MFMSAKLSARGVAKSSGSAEIAREVDSVAAENFITVLLLSSTLSRESWMKSLSGSHDVTTKNENTPMRTKIRIFLTGSAYFLDSMFISPYLFFRLTFSL